VGFSKGKREKEAKMSINETIPNYQNQAPLEGGKSKAKKERPFRTRGELEKERIQKRWKGRKFQYGQKVYQSNKEKISRGCRGGTKYRDREKRIRRRGERETILRRGKRRRR